MKQNIVRNTYTYLQSNLIICVKFPISTKTACGPQTKTFHCLRPVNSSGTCIGWTVVVVYPKCTHDVKA